MRRDPAVRFWLGYVEREGGLVEDAGYGAVVVLPPRMRERFDLPEVVSVTSDPDVAREDGALLLIPGNPALDAASAAVLEEGDVGTIHLEWPRKAPDRELLLALARDQIAVEHGRIDAGGEPVPRYAPVLRVGVQITYHANDRFQERDEVWVDARGGLAVPPHLVRQLAAAPRLTGRPEHLSLEPSLVVAIREAHAIIERRASERRDALVRQSEASLRDELTQAERFYDAALESNAQRRAAAAPERQTVFDAQAEATRGERKRRLQEIREKFEGRHEIRPVRLHLIQVPSLQLPVLIRRGARTFPFALTWWLPAASFAGLRCPSCGTAAPLVAAKDRLGCQACLARPTPAPQLRTVSPEPVAAPAPATPKPDVKPASPPAAAPPSGKAAREVKPVDEPEEWRRRYEEQRRRVQRIGGKLGGDFWEAVAGGDPWPRKRAHPHSPMRVLYRLYGPGAPLRGVGVPLGALPEHTSFRTADPDPHLLHSTWGSVVAGGQPYTYTLRWRLDGGKPAVDEIVPSMIGWSTRLPQRSALSPSIAERLHEGAPLPRIDLDPVATALWRSELPASGLPLVVRCLAAWWRVEDKPLFSAHPPPVLAAALAAMIGRRAGLARTRVAAAADHGADPDEVAAAARRLQALLGLSDVRSW